MITTQFSRRKDNLQEVFFTEKNSVIICRNSSNTYGDYKKKDILTVVINMGKIQSSEELMKFISSMNSDNSVFQFSIPGKGKFTLILQEEEEQSIQSEAEENPELTKMLKESQEQYKNGDVMSTKELLKSLSKKDFM